MCFSGHCHCGKVAVLERLNESECLDYLLGPIKCREVAFSGGFTAGRTG